MKLKAEYKSAIVEEFDYASRAMQEAETPEEKIFYFSSTYGVLSRVFNFQFDPQLGFMHLVLNSSHSSVLARLQAKRGGDSTVELPEDFFERLTSAVKGLSERIKSNNDVYDILERIALLTYVTTGNGFFLLKKGVAKLE